MLSWSKISAARASAAPGPARCREIYQRYAAVLYRQALHTPPPAARAWADEVRMCVAPRS